MKFYFSLLLSFFMITISIQGMDKYNIGDEVFVWAKNGLNLRVSTNVKSKILQTLSFGTQVTVVSKTEISYNINALSNLASEKVEPLIFYGNWVEVVTESGQSGFVIDQYLLEKNPSVKTTKTSENESKSVTNNNIEDEVYSFSTLYVFPNSSIEEVFIQMQISKDFILSRNKKNEAIILSGCESCVYTFKTLDNTTTVDVSCSC